MRLPTSVIALLLTAACSTSQGVSREPAAKLTAEPVAVRAAPPAIVPLPTGAIAVASAPEPRQHHKVIFLRGLSGVGCGRG